MTSPAVHLLLRLLVTHALWVMMACLVVCVVAFVGEKRRLYDVAYAVAFSTLLVMLAATTVGVVTKVAGVW